MLMTMPASMSVWGNAGFNPPVVEETKRKFIHGYKKPIAGLYNTVLQELLVQMHFIRHNLSYEYNEVRRAVKHLALAESHPGVRVWL